MAIAEPEPGIEMTIMDKSERRRARADRLRAMTKDEKELRDAPIASVAEKFFALDIVAGQFVSAWTLRFFLIVALLNGVRHASFFFMSRKSSIYFGNYFFLWTDPEFTINAGIMIGQAVTICCGFPFYYFINWSPEVIEPTLRALATIHGMSKSSLPVETINKLRRGLSKTDILLNNIVISMVLALIEFTHMGYVLVGDDDVYYTSIIWPAVQFVGAIGTSIFAYGTAMLFLAQNLVLAARLRQVRDQLIAIKNNLMKCPIGTTKSRTVSLRSSKATIKILDEYEKICLDIAACNRFWKYPAFGLAVTCMPSVVFSMFFVVATDMKMVAILICIAVVVSLSFFGSLFFLSASQVNNLSAKCHAPLNSIYVRCYTKNMKFRHRVGETLKQFEKPVCFTAADCVNMQFVFYVPLVEKVITYVLLMVLGLA